MTKGRVASPYKHNPSFRGRLVRLYGKGGQRPIRYATHAFIYFPDRPAVRLDFPSSKKKIADKEKYLINAVTRLDRKFIREEVELALKKKKELAEKARRKREKAKKLPPTPPSVLKAEVKLHAKNLRDILDLLDALDEDVRALQTQSELIDILLDRITERELERELEEEAEEEEEEIEPPLKKKLPPMKFDEHFVTHGTNNPESPSEVTAALAGRGLTSNIRDLNYAEPFEIKKENKVHWLNLMKEEFKKFARESFNEVPGRSEFLLRIKTWEHHRSLGKHNSGFWAFPGRVKIESMKEMMTAVDILFSSFIESYDKYVLQTVTRSIFIRGFSIEQVIGVTAQRY